MAMGTNIKMLRQAKGLTSSALAEMVGMSSQALHNLETRDSNRSRYTIEIATALGVSVEDLLTGNLTSQKDAEMFLDMRRALGDDFDPDEEAPPALSHYQKSHIVILSLPNPLKEAAFSLVRSEIVSSMRVEKDWLHRTLAIKELDGLRVFSASGDSMSPTINHGDLVLVDTRETEIGISGVYVLQHPGETVFIRRIQKRVEGGLWIGSDNATLYPPETLPALDKTKVKTVGRALFVWRGGSL